MPIYEFKCQVCKKCFEQLCPISWQSKVRCPHCGSVNLEKVISQFSSKGLSSTTKCHSCSGGNCGSCH